MAKFWFDLMSNAQHVIAWSNSGVDILNPLDWFVMNPVFGVSADTRERILLSKKSNGQFYIKKQIHSEEKKK
jgi:hypothetical protein